MNFTKATRPKTLPANANPYVYDVLSDDRYPDRTVIEIDSDGGVQTYIDWGLPQQEAHRSSRRYRMTCELCNTTIWSLSWDKHLESKKHVRLSPVLTDPH